MIEVTEENRWEPRVCRVRLRRDLGSPVKPTAEQIDGQHLTLRAGWRIEEEDHRLYAGEWAMLVEDARGYWDKFPEAPLWIASGDLEDVACPS